MKMVVAFNDFVRRQTAESRFTHWDISDEELLSRVSEGWESGRVGYRDGVWLVPVAGDGFWTPVVELEEGDVLQAEIRYEARVEGEDPRRVTVVTGVKCPAGMVEVVCYRRDVLAEDGGAMMIPDVDWEIVSVNGVPGQEPSPIGVMTLLANHFKVSGGTATNLSDSELVEKLRESFLYWNKHVIVDGSLG